MPLWALQGIPVRGLVDTLMDDLMDDFMDDSMDADSWTPAEHQSR